MAHPKIMEAHKGLIEELEALVQKKGGEIEFKGTIVFVVDPDVDTDFGDEKIGVEKLRYDKKDKTVYADGAAYDNGIRLDDAESIDAENLSVEELAMLIDAAEAQPYGKYRI